MSRGREESQLLHKKKVKSETLRDKNKKEKQIQTKCISAITKNFNWQILTKNLVAFKRQDGVKDEKS